MDSSVWPKKLNLVSAHAPSHFKRSLTSKAIHMMEMKQKKKPETETPFSGKAHTRSDEECKEFT